MGAAEDTGTRRFAAGPTGRIRGGEHLHLVVHVLDEPRQLERSRPDGAKRIFLYKNEDVFVASEGDIVDRRYKVVRISPNAVEILDVLSNNRENIPLSQG